MDSNSSSVSPALQNIQLAWHVLNELSQLGITEFCVCPGARNAPWVALLAENPGRFRCFYFYEERSAAFFALGRIRKTGNPVGVITTSGTAVGELLPATMEGFYSGLPLVLLTADRPSRYRGSGAPQAAQQVGIFGPYVSQCWDLEGAERPSFLANSLASPFHINACFEEPLLDPKLSLKWEEWVTSPSVSIQLELPPLRLGEDSDSGTAEIQKFLKQVRFPVAVVGYLPESDQEAVVKLLLSWKIPCYLEALSGLREDPRLAPFRIHSADRWMERGTQVGYRIDGALRLGGIPTLRFWRDLDAGLSHLPVLSLSGLAFSGLARASSLLIGFQGKISGLCRLLRHQLQLEIRLTEGKDEAKDRFLALDHERENASRRLLITEPTSEPGMVAALSERFAKGSAVYLGNSLPIREWDLAATREDRNFEIWASRGLNGIDGQVSTFLGFAGPGKENWAILGDLTTLYDLPGPWILPQLLQTQVNLVVINNQGGQIFSRMFPYAEFQNRHQIRFRAWAELWGLSYESWTCVPSLDQAVNQVLGVSSGMHRLIELLPDEAATQRFWEQERCL